MTSSENQSENFPIASSASGPALTLTEETKVKICLDILESKPLKIQNALFQRIQQIENRLQQQQNAQLCGQIEGANSMIHGTMTMIHGTFTTIRSIEGQVSDILGPDLNAEPDVNAGSVTPKSHKPIPDYTDHDSRKAFKFGQYWICSNKQCAEKITKTLNGYADNAIQGHVCETETKPKKSTQEYRSQIPVSSQNAQGQMVSQHEQIVSLGGIQCSSRPNHAVAARHPFQSLYPDSIAHQAQYSSNQSLTKPQAQFPNFPDRQYNIIRGVAPQLLQTENQQARNIRPEQMPQANQQMIPPRRQSPAVFVTNRSLQPNPIAAARHPLPYQQYIVPRAIQAPSNDQSLLQSQFRSYSDPFLQTTRKRDVAGTPIQQQENVQRTQIQQIVHPSSFPAVDPAQFDFDEQEGLNFELEYGEPDPNKASSSGNKNY